MPDPEVRIKCDVCGDDFIAKSKKSKRCPPPKSCTRMAIADWKRRERSEIKTQKRTLPPEIISRRASKGGKVSASAQKLNQSGPFRKVVF